MKRIFLIAIAALALTSCEYLDQKDEAAEVNKIKVTIDAVAVDDDGHETYSTPTTISIPKD